VCDYFYGHDIFVTADILVKNIFLVKLIIVINSEDRDIDENNVMDEL